VKAPEVAREPGIHEVTYYRWRKEYGGLRVNQMKRLKELEKEDSRLRSAVSDLTAGTIAEASCDCQARIDLTLVRECSDSHSPYPEDGVRGAR